MADYFERLQDERCPIYQRAFPNTDWGAAAQELTGLTTLADKVNYLANNFPGIVRIACMGGGNDIQAQLERTRKAFAQILNHPHYSDKTGADLGLTMLSPTMLDGLQSRYAVTSSSVKLGEVAAVANTTPQVYGGAKVHFLIMMMPSRQGGDVSAMHADTILVPNDPRDEQYVTCTSISYPEPFFTKERQVLMDRLKLQNLDIAKNEGTFHNLLVHDNIGVWGPDCITIFVGTEHFYLTSVELLAQCRTPGLEKPYNNAPSISLFQLRMSCSVSLTREEHSALKRLKHLNDLSVSRGHVMMNGRGTSENSCFSHCFYDIACVKDGFYPAGEVWAKTPDVLLNELVQRADTVYVAKEFGGHLRLGTYLDPQHREQHYEVASEEAGAKAIRDVFESKALYNIYKGGSTTSWANKYMTHGDALPEDVERFFTHVMDCAAWAEFLPI
ncbi:hypothetical protein MCOR25_010649 [Pyricularia grisea]|nr:hypothetical protein MCOR25_010649 [Pyricularia grisea]